MNYAIEFRYPDVDAPVYAGMYKGALGWALQLETAIIWNDRETAERILKNGYGGTAKYGTVIEVPE